MRFAPIGCGSAAVAAEAAGRAKDPYVERTEMGDTSLIRAALLAALITAFGFAATGRAPAGEPPAANGMINLPRL